ncbi:hypothetical protein [Mycobacterium avium]|uniref:hypothetical protein n=1 Tax=Mycobacterium avium TaxID=1764 RepID=UPI0020D11294|nr:hypothetical protein [Mycobacterium avium]
MTAEITNLTDETRNENAERATSVSGGRSSRRRGVAAPVAVGLAAAASVAAAAATWYRGRPRSAGIGQARPEEVPAAVTTPAVRAAAADVAPVPRERGTGAARLTVVKRITPALIAVLAVFSVGAGFGFVVVPDLIQRIQQPPTTAAPSAVPTDPLAEPSRLIPMSSAGEERSGRCTADGVCSGQLLTMELGGDGPWVVTQVGFRPLELVPGRRVTRVRWELHSMDGGVVQFPQTADTSGHNIAVVHLRPTGNEYRTWWVTAIVEASVPAPDAVRTGLGPFEAYGYPAPRSGEAEFPTRATPAAVRWPVAPFTVSRITILPGSKAAPDTAPPGRP